MIFNPNQCGLFGQLSGGLGAGPAQREVVKMKKKNPTGLQVHLEDMSWV